MLDLDNLSARYLERRTIQRQEHVDDPITFEDLEKVNKIIKEQLTLKRWEIPLIPRTPLQ